MSWLGIDPVTIKGMVVERLPPRFWTKVIVSDGCWLWTGHRTRKGYGTFRLRRRMVSAHRLAYTALVGQIPDGLNVLHSCDTASCVNPAHLRPGTHGDNVRDRQARCRQARGERIAAAKLNAEKVREIRQRYAAGGVLQRELAAEFGISDMQVSSIVRRKKWAHVLPEKA
jgi:hypothetical protein